MGWKKERDKQRETPQAPAHCPLEAPRAPAYQRPPTEPLHVDYNIFVVGADRKVDPYMASVEISGAEIDTGSALTLVSQATFSQL